MTVTVHAPAVHAPTSRRPADRERGLPSSPKSRRAPASRPQASPGPSPAPTGASGRRSAAGRITVYGDVTCPWSYLAARRAAVLEAAGVEVDWRMVEHDRPVPGRPPRHDERLAVTRQDLDRVTRRLLPGETLPHSPAELVPYTGPAVSGYAEGYVAGVGPRVRELLFEAFWMHGVDLGDARVVRSLLADTLRDGRSPSELVRDWGYAVDVTGAPVTTAAWRLVHDWRAAWSSGGEVVPALAADGGARVRGVEAVEWLGAEVARRGLAPDAPPYPGGGGRRNGPTGGPASLVDRYWASEHGNRWMQQRRAATAGPLFDRLRPWI